jgi:hypothetical protein
MPLGAPGLSAVSILQVGTSSTPPAPNTPVGGLLSWDWVGDSPTTRRDYIGQGSSTAVGKTARTITVPVDYEVGDTGQALLAAAFVSKAIIFVRLLPDGTNGEILPVRVAHQEIHAPDANGFNTATWTLEQAGDPTAVAGGFFT